MLGIDWKDILLHMGNLFVLLLIVYFGLYKKIKSYMNRRSDEYRAAEDDIAARKGEAEKAKAEYDALIGRANGEIARINEEASVVAEMQAKAVLEEAKKTAKLIIDRAENDMRFEKAKMKAEFKNEVADVAVDIAKKILAREINGEDTERVIDESLSAWMK